MRAPWYQRLMVDERGFLGAILPILSAIGGISSWIGGTRQNQRQQQTNDIYAQNRSALEQYGIQQGARSRAGENQQQADALAAQQQQGTDFRLADLDLLRRRFGLEAPGTRLRTGVTGDIIANIRDTPMSHPRANVVNFKTLASALGPTSRQLGALTAQQMLEAQLAGDEFADVPVTPIPVRDFSQDLLTPPTPTAFPQPGRLDTALNILGGVGGGAEAAQSVAAEYAKRKLPPIPQSGFYVPNEQPVPPLPEQFARRPIPGQWL